jgi:hypothetical protein
MPKRIRTVGIENTVRDYLESIGSHESPKQWYFEGNAKSRIKKIADFAQERHPEYYRKRNFLEGILMEYRKMGSFKI